MLVDKLNWVSHGGAGTPLYSLDIHPNGTRLATSGSDHKVKIWSLTAALSVQAEASNSSKLLATLADHGGPVNVIRFSHSGRFLATASDDKVIAISELRVGQGQSSFGSSEGPNIENWKVALTLRGHSANIPDLNWSQDDTLLASCSLDNLVLVWDTTSGQLLHTLKQHTSFVKGVAWDPMNRYLASQSDDRSVIVWDRTTWTPVAHVVKPFAKGFVSSTFSLRIDWSPEGSFLACVNSFQSPCHVCPLIQRGTWIASKQNLVGHSHAVVVARFNPKMFYKDEDEISPCIALGSQDSRLSVWVLHKERPVFIGAKFFERSVVDLAWTPDGYTLLASSMDGSVAQFSFDESDLGKAVPEEELEKIKKKVPGAHATALRFAESAEQQHMEIEDNILPAPLSPGFLGSSNHALAGRLAPGHGLPSSLQPGPSQPQTQVSTKRRIAPEAVGPDQVATGTQFNLTNSAKNHPVLQSRPPKAPSSLPNGGAAAPGAVGSKRKASDLPTPAASRRRVTPESIPDLSGQAGSVQQGRPAILGPGHPVIAFEQEPQLHVELGKEPMPLGDEHEGGSRVLEAVLRSNQWELVCHSSGLQQWTDRVPGKVVAVGGSMRFAAAAFESALLQVYTPAGRRMFPALKLSAAPVSLSSDGAWRLLALCRDGTLRVWDLQRLTSLLDTSLAPLVAATPAGTAVRQVQLSKSGVPQAVMSNRTAWLYHTGLASWLCLADSAFAASPFTSLLPLNPALQGDLSRIQQQASSSGRGLPGGGVLGSAGGLGQGRGHLEANMVAALALQSPQEFRRWLTNYACHLAGEGDEGRLRELCMELLGQGQHFLSDQSGDTGWSPTICGLDKKKLLQDEVLKRLNDKHQSIRRFKSEMFELLSDLQERTELAAV